MLTVDAKALKSAVAIVAKVAASPKDGCPQLAGIHIRVPETFGTVDLVATDGFRLTCATIATDGDREPVAATLDLKALKAALKACPNRGDVNLYPANGSWSVGGAAVPVIPGTYPDYRSIIPSAQDGDAYAVDVDGMLLALTLIAKPAKGDTHVAHLYGTVNQPNPQLVALTATGTPYERYERWFHGAANAASFHTTPAFLTSVNPKYLQDIVASHRGQTLTLRVSNGHNAMRFDATGVIHVLMPIVIDADKRPALSCAAAATPPAAEPSIAMVPVVGRVDAEAEPVKTGQYRAVVPLACSQCGSHEIRNPDDDIRTAYCDECMGAAVIDPNVVYGPIIRDAGPTEHGGIDVERARENVAIKRAQRKATWSDRSPSGYPTMVHRVCGACGAPAKTADVYCYQCGVNLSTGKDDTAHCSCGAVLEPADRFCSQCGTATPLAGTTSAPVRIDTPAADDARVAATFVPITRKYSGKNPDRILAAMPAATDVRGFHDWLKVGRCVMKGQHGILIYVPIVRDAVSTHWQTEGQDAGKKTAGVRKAYVFDISQTAPLPPRADRPARMTHAAAD